MLNTTTRINYRTSMSIALFLLAAILIAYGSITFFYPVLPFVFRERVWYRFPGDNCITIAQKWPESPIIRIGSSFGGIPNVLPHVDRTSYTIIVTNDAFYFPEKRVTQQYIYLDEEQSLSINGIGPITAGQYKPFRGNTCVISDNEHVRNR